MKSLALLLSVLLALPLLAVADQSGIVECRKVENALERLVCYDEIVIQDNETVEDAVDQAISTLSEPETELATGLSEWERREERDPISDRKNISFFAEPTGPHFNLFGGEKTVFLQLRCFDNTTAVVLFFDDFQIQDRLRLAVRIDENEPVDANWSLASNRQAAGLWSGSESIPFIKSLRDAKLITIRAFLEDGAETYQFESKNINAYASELSEACDWEF